MSDLVGHLRGRPSTPRRRPSLPRLALCASRWWEDDKDEALVELAEAARASKSDPELLLGDGRAPRAQRNEPEEALKVADSFEPLDQKAMKRREVLAIRLAVVTGDVARARKAAERLFGLRLDADTQVQLASQMHQLGMHELAEAVLGRARRRAGGNLGAIVSLMLQYQRQGKADVAVQVANQVLRRNPARANPGYYDEGAEARIRGHPGPRPLRQDQGDDRDGSRTRSSGPPALSSSTSGWPTTTRPPATRARPSSNTTRWSGSAPTTPGSGSRSPPS